MKPLALLVPGLLLGFVLTAALLCGWMLMSTGASGQSSCDSSTLSGNRVPATLAPLFTEAASRYRLGAEGASILAGLTEVESDFGRNMGPSSAGAVGWTQFMPDTWRRFGVDADGDGRADPMSADDAITSAARYLSYLGAPGDWHRALLGYNHAEWYVTDVLDHAKALTGPVSDLDALTGCSSVEPGLTTGTGSRIFGGGRIVPIPGQPGETADERIVPDILLLQQRFHFVVTAAYATSGHEPGGEHPLGLAVDLAPGPGGTWDDIDALARWAEPEQNHPRSPFRWVGYDGDAGHGRGNHLHLSWEHGAAAGGPPVPWVRVLSAGP
jgi:Transglycosylase SLT domain